MKLVPLLGRSGHVKAWGDRETGWISDLTGKFFALVAFDGVFDRTGAQIGWWHFRSARSCSPVSTERKNTKAKYATAKTDATTSEFTLAVGPSNVALVVNGTAKGARMGRF